MNKQEKIKQLYFNEKYNQKEIAKVLDVSYQYVSKVLLSDIRYKEEKEKRKENNRKKHLERTKKCITNSRRNREIEYARLKQLHIQATIELSGGKGIINNRAFRNWNSSIFRYDK